MARDECQSDAKSSVSEFGIRVTRDIFSFFKGTVTIKKNVENRCTRPRRNYFHLYLLCKNRESNQTYIHVCPMIKPSLDGYNDWCYEVTQGDVEGEDVLRLSETATSYDSDQRRSIEQDGKDAEQREEANENVCIYPHLETMMKWTMTTMMMTAMIMVFTDEKLRLLVTG